MAFSLARAPNASDSRADPVAETPPGDEHQRFDHDAHRHLRPPERAVAEGDGDLDDGAAGVLGEVGHLHLEPVAVGA